VSLWPALKAKKELLLMGSNASGISASGTTRTFRDVR
jgi:hypothetical protein